MPRPLELPPRYEPVAALGKGGGGEVWSVRDLITGRVLALKTLAEGASAEEVEALVREATALSGLEGLGVPRVLRFGRLPESGRPYLVRELCEGSSLSSLLDDPDAARGAIAAVASVADLLTRLHRAQLLHGDVKPANVIVGGGDRAMLVDLGLASAFKEGGTRPVGLTPRYAAPELLAGGPLTVRAEVFSLGAMLRDVVDAARPRLDAPEAAALDAVVARATEPAPEGRYPSADELASALRLAAKLPLASAPAARAWPILGLDGAAHALRAQVERLRPGGGVLLAGPHGAGSSELLRRVAWSLGVAGRKVAWLEPAEVDDPARALEIELSPVGDPSELVVLVDDAEWLPPSLHERLASLREAGARVVLAAIDGAAVRGDTLEIFAMPELDPGLAKELVLRAVPSLGDAVVAHVVARAQGWPGALRGLVERLAGAPIVAPEDVDRLLDGDAASGGEGGAVDVARRALERGHIEEAAEALAALAGRADLPVVILRARLLTHRGEARRAVAELSGASHDLEAAPRRDRLDYWVELARAALRAGDYPASSEASQRAIDEGAAAEAGEPGLLAKWAEAHAVAGLAESYEARHEDAERSLARGVELARRAEDPRILSVALGSLAFALQRNGKLDASEKAHEEALTAAERAGDAGSVATTRLNLAGIAKKRGDLAQALAHLEAAVDMGRRSGRQATLRQALLNLANLDLYLGRVARALTSIEALASERAMLPPHLGAQLLSLEGEAAAKQGDHARAEELCEATSAAYEALGRLVDGAEARLEGIVNALERPGVEAAALGVRLARAEAMLSGSTAHRALVAYARGRIALAGGDTDAAREAFDLAIAHAEADGQREWLAQAYRARALAAQEDGQRLAARKDREAALAVLEEIAKKLPRDLREVYWDEPRRRQLRAEESGGVLAASVHGAPILPSRADVTRSGTIAPVAPAGHDRLARVLEINRELAGTYDLRRLLERVTDLAISLLSAERGFVLLKSHRAATGKAEVDLSIHASRDQAGDDPHARFSQSIAERVVSTGEPIATTSARDDARMADYVSVHQLMLQSVACVPIRSRSAGVIGALYLETRLRPGTTFADELPVLVALADQVAIAIDTARLVGENERRAAELEQANVELRAARAKLEELLGHRTEQLEATRRDLRSARAVLKSHFGYEGLVGTSEAMRRVYALIDRIKDTDVPVLLTGESGTGKEIIARAIHKASPRQKKPFVGINCGAIPEHLLESELFGHVRGAFTGADRDRKGLFREAHEGTILLDEIGEMPIKMQAGLLRVLQEKLVRPVGGPREEPVDTRVVAATHRDLSAMVEAARFREDLFYRLNVIQVRVPPLRERADDIPMLIDHFLGIFAARYGRDRRSVSRAALRMLTSYRWPGNVRQLENALLNAWVLSDSPELEPEDFELPDVAAVVPSGSRVSVAPSPLATSLDAHKKTERDRIVQALTSCNWNRVRAAEQLGMPRRTFYRRLKDYGIQ